jgi:C4-dicarboxylate-specific signal transduction histidine kinase
MSQPKTTQEIIIERLRATLARERIVFTDVIADMNQRLIDRTEGLMRSLATQTLRERYVPQARYDALRSVLIEIIRNFATDATEDQHAQTLETARTLLISPPPP